jgi:hypothetical protein
MARRMTPGSHSSQYGSPYRTRRKKRIMPPGLPCGYAIWRKAGSVKEIPSPYCIREVGAAQKA